MNSVQDKRRWRFSKIVGSSEGGNQKRVPQARSARKSMRIEHTVAASEFNNKTRRLSF